METDGYGRFWIGRGSDRIMVRLNRYALAASLHGRQLAPWVRALHGCDNPACVRVSLPGEVGLLHIVGGTQRDNIVMMTRAGPNILPARWSRITSLALEPNPRRLLIEAEDLHSG